MPKLTTRWNGKHLASIYRFDFGKYGLDHEIWKELKARLKPYELIQRFNAMEDYYFTIENGVTSGVHWLAAIGGGKVPISVHYQADQGRLKVFHRNVPNDLDGGPHLNCHFIPLVKTRLPFYCLAGP